MFTCRANIQGGIAKGLVRYQICSSRLSLETVDTMGFRICCRRPQVGNVALVFLLPGRLEERMQTELGCYGRR